MYLFLFQLCLIFDFFDNLNEVLVNSKDPLTTPKSSEVCLKILFWSVNYFVFPICGNYIFLKL